MTDVTSLRRLRGCGFLYRCGRPRFSACVNGDCCLHHAAILVRWYTSVIRMYLPTPVTKIPSISCNSDLSHIPRNCYHIYPLFSHIELIVNVGANSSQNTFIALLPIFATLRLSFPFLLRSYLLSVTNKDVTNLKNIRFQYNKFDYNLKLIN